MATKAHKKSGRKPSPVYVRMKKAMATRGEAVYQIPPRVSLRRAKFRVQFFLKGDDLPKLPRGKTWRMSSEEAEKGRLLIHVGKARSDNRRRKR